MDQRCLDNTGADWKWGIAARQHLINLAADRPWTCTTVRKNVYGRQFANCRVGDDDIARNMVLDGWAIASTTGVATYLPDEEKAKSAAAGLWAGTFVAPLDWRQHNWHGRILGRVLIDEKSSDRLLTSAFGAMPPSEKCAIKGNTNWSGQRIFHKPGGRRYKRITMEGRYGDRWFCSQIEAIASGCRETRRRSDQEANMSFKSPDALLVSFEVELRGTDMTDFMVVETELHLNPRHPQYDEAAVRRLIEAARGYLAVSGHPSIGIRLVLNRGGRRSPAGACGEAIGRLAHHNLAHGGRGGPRRIDEWHGKRS